MIRETTFNFSSVKNALSKKAFNFHCPMCNENEFSIVDGFFRHNMENVLDGNFRIGKRYIPSIVTYCNNCGFMNFHALGQLGLIPKEGEV